MCEIKNNWLTTEQMLSEYECELTESMLNSPKLYGKDWRVKSEGVIYFDNRYLTRLYNFRESLYNEADYLYYKLILSKEDRLIYTLIIDNMIMDITIIDTYIDNNLIQFVRKARRLYRLKNQGTFKLDHI